MPKLKKMMKLNSLKVPWAHPDGHKRKKCRTENTKEEKENVVRAIIMHKRKIYHANLGHPYSSQRSRILLEILLARERAAAASMKRILGSCMHIMKD